MTKHRLYRRAAAALIGIALTSCAAPTQTTGPDHRQSVRRKPVPNLDRTHDWGSMPPPGAMRTHASD
jgi:hypothetical protein